MSGPKLSQAELERLRMEELERERQAALKRLQRAQSAYRTECDKANAIKANAASLVGRVDAVYRSETEVRVKAVMKNVRIISVSDVKSPESYDAAADEMKKNIDAAARELDTVLEVALKRMKNNQEMIGKNLSYQLFQSVAGNIGEEVSSIKIDFRSNYDRDVVRHQLEAVLKHFKMLSNQKNALEICQFSQAAVGAVEGVLKNKKAWANLDAVRLVMQKIINDEQELIRQWKERRSLYGEYFALVSMTDQTPRRPNEFETLMSLKQEIAQLRHLYRKQDEMDYIANQINDVMVDLGYTFVTSRVLMKKDQGETDFSLYEADEHTGIAVYTDQSGAVMMRMTVLGDDPVITDADRDFSYQRQIDFCAGHPEIVAALAERGVFLKQKSYQEPNRTHTYKTGRSRQNTAIDSGSPKKGMVCQKIDRRRRRRAGIKKVRAM